MIEVLDVDLVDGNFYVSCEVWVVYWWMWVN